MIRNDVLYVKIMQSVSCSNMSLLILFVYITILFVHTFLQIFHIPHETVSVSKV